ncbi:hypothetical protein AMECASPLE_034997 [Ameca splendens]|uniref:Uncharacterized protein n=1 Tax=Ameca splendens TaxID=208324 RepID=A0ABV0XW65_9TELE
MTCTDSSSTHQGQRGEQERAAVYEQQLWRSVRSRAGQQIKYCSNRQQDDSLAVRTFPVEDKKAEYF